MKSVAVRWVLVAIAVIGLGIDAYTHFDLASLYAGNGSSITQEQLFYAEGVIAILAALALIVRVNRLTVGLAFLVSAGGLALLLLYRFVDVGSVGPLPDMYEPIWYDEKSVSAWFEAVAAIATAALMLLVVLPGRRRIPS